METGMGMGNGYGTGILGAPIWGMGITMRGRGRKTRREERRGENGERRTERNEERKDERETVVFSAPSYDLQIQIQSTLSPV
mgnify:CR=1 FL=1